MKNVEDLGLIQRLLVRLNDWQTIRQLRKIRALLVSCGYDPKSADEAVVKILRELPVPGLDRWPTSDQRQYRERVVGMWLVDRGMNL